VEHSALQGSVWGPLLVLLQINLTENVPRVKLVLFADDTNWLITGKDEFDLQHKTFYQRTRNMVSKNNITIINAEKNSRVISFKTNESSFKTGYNF
jgi:hypothetical protein